MFRRLVRFFTKSNIHKQKDNQKKCSSNLCVCTNIQKVIHNVSNISSVFTEAIKNTIPKSRFHVNITSVLGTENGVKLAAINVRPKYPAEKLMKSPENACSQGLVKSISIKPTLSILNLLVNKTTTVSWQQGFIKLTKHTLVSYLIVSTVLVGSGIIFLFNPFGGGVKQAEAAWPPARRAYGSESLMT